MAGRANPLHDGPAVPAAVPWLFVASLACALILPRLAGDGMFLDGVIYASIARNLAEGRGSFWSPAFTETLYPVFSEHPPLFFGVESLAFRLLGDGIVVERLASLLFGVVVAGLVVACWRRLRPDTAGLSWLPVGLWLLCPMVAWAYAYNMLETLLSVFTTAAVLLALAACNLRPFSVARLTATAGAGLCVAGAVLTKGPVGLFPLAAFGCLWIAGGRTRLGPAVADSCAMLAVLAACAGLLWQIEPARAAMLRYVDSQVLASLSGSRGVDGGTLRGLRAYGAAIGIPLAVVLSVGAAAWRGGWRPSSQSSKDCAAMALIGLSASLPLFVSPRLHSFYLVPSLPFFALGGAAIVAEPVERWLARIGRSHAVRLRGAGLAALALAAAAGLAWPALTHGRDAATIAAVKDIVAATVHRPLPGRRVVLQGCAALRQEWGLLAYLERYGRVSVAFDGRPAKLFLWAPACTEDMTGRTPLTDGAAYRLYRNPSSG